MSSVQFDNATNGGTATATSLSFTHYCSGANRLLFVFCVASTDVITGVTYGGVAMTLITKQASPSEAYLYVLNKPLGGPNTIVISASGSTTLLGIASSYNECQQTVTPDAFASASAPGIADGAATGVGVTTTVDNCWVINGAFKTGPGVPTAASNCITRQNGAGICLCDSNGVQTPAGARTNSVNDVGDGTQDWNHIAVSFAPYFSSKMAGYRNIEVGNGMSRSEGAT